MKTRADVIVGVLQNLSIFAPGQTVRTAAGSTVTYDALKRQVLQNIGILTGGQTAGAAPSSTQTQDVLIKQILQNFGVYGVGQAARTSGPAATKTRTDLKNFILQELQAYGAGQSPSADDVADIESQLDGVLEEIKTRHVYSGGITFPLPDDVFVPLASVAAALLGAPWGVVKINGIDVETYRQNAERRLLRVELARGSGPTMVAERLPSALNELKNRGVYSGGVSSTYADDVVPALAAAVASLIAEPLGIEKINGVDLFTYRADAEKRLLRVELVRGSASTMLNERINGAIEELKTRGIYLGGVTSNYPDDIYVPLAAAVSPMVATPLGIEKIDGMDLDTYRLKAEDRLYRADLARGRGYDMVEARLDGVIAELSSLGIYGGVSDDEFEDEVYPSLTEAAAALLAVPFRLNQVAGMDVESYRLRAESRLRRVFQTGYRGYVTRAEYF
jgi:phosphoglycolate phosphatase-like HAD superfamily hydrolase